MSSQNLEKKIFQLESLVEVSKIVNSTLELTKILDYFRQSAKKNLEAEFCTIYLINEEKQMLCSVAIEDKRIDKIELPIGKGMAGTVAANGHRIITNNAYSDKRFDSDIDKKIGGHTDNLCTVPMKNFNGKIIGVIQLMNKKGGFSDDDAEFLENLAIPAAIAVDNSKLHKIQIAKERLDREMELASEVQRMLLPDKFPEKNNIIADIIYKPYFQVSGDIYDFIKLDENKIGIAIGDVSGKGVSAAMIMSTIKSIFSMLAKEIRSTSKICSFLNKAITRLTQSRRFCTFFYAIIDTKNNKLTFTNAGHNPPILIKVNGEYIMLKGGGPVIGAIENTHYDQSEVNFNKGDILLLYTDGVTESTNPKKEMYSEKRLIKDSLESINKSNLAHIIDEKLHIFMKDDKKQVDDYTIIIIKYV